MTESLTYWKPPGLPGSIRFAYWFKGNANVLYLLSLAPASAWGSVGMHDGGRVTLDEANKLLIGTLNIMWDDGWVIERYTAAENEIC